MKEEEIRKFVRMGYADVARGSGSCCGPRKSGGCCGAVDSFKNASKAIGYTDEDVNSVPDGANLGLGCGNPVAQASIREGEIVLDLGSGAGFDCFLAARRVGNRGKVIGVDMTPEMLEKARENAEKGGYRNVEFRLGEIENLPVADNTIDLIISNCVINLSPRKDQVFREAYRVLKPGGRLMVSDIVLLKELPESVTKSVVAYIGCVAGATAKENYLDAIIKAGFVDVKIADESKFDIEFVSSDPAVKQVLYNEKISKADLVKAGNSIRSIKVSAVKPGK